MNADASQPQALPALASAKAGAGVLRVTAASVRRVRVPKPPTLTSAERHRVALMLAAAPDTAVRVLAVLVEIDGFSLPDAAAIVGMTPMNAREQLRSVHLLAAEHGDIERRTLAAELLKKRTADKTRPTPRQVRPRSQPRRPKGTS